MVSYDEFRSAYIQSCADVKRHWSEALQREMAVHNAGLRPENFDLHNYFQRSISRFYNAYKGIASRQVASVCDIGCLGGVFPLTLKRIGFDVAVTEALKFYSSIFLKFLELHDSQGVTIVDYNPFGDEVPPHQYDAVFCLAVLEHYPHSIKGFARNLNALVRDGGCAYIEVPLITYLFKRIDLLKGISPLATIDLISESETPFTGHHHEYSMAELNFVAKMANLKVAKEFWYSYSADVSGIKKLLFDLITRYIPTAHEMGAVLCIKQP